MVVPSTGSPENATTLLSMFGESVVLEDTTEIKGVLRWREIPSFGDPGLVSTDRTWRLGVPTSSLFDNQVVQVRGTDYFAANPVSDLDGWTYYELQERQP